MRHNAAIALFGFMSATCAVAQTFDMTSEISLQGRWYPKSPIFSDQKSSTLGAVAKTTLHVEINSQTSFTFTPLYRYDSADSHRTHGAMYEKHIS